MRSPRLMALGGILAATAVLAPQCTIAIGGSDVDLVSSLSVFHKATGPGTQLIPWVRAVGKAVIHTPPRGGTVAMSLWYRRGLIGTWHFAGRKYIGNPWIKGATREVVIDYVCLYNNSWWRINYVWDAVLHDGTPDKSPPGGTNWPSNRGMRMTCVVLESAPRGARVREAAQ